jgi:hypothetical protein
MLAGPPEAGDAPHALGDGSGPHTDPGSPPNVVSARRPWLVDIVMAGSQPDSDDEEELAPPRSQLVRHSACLLTAAISFNMPHAPDLEPFRRRVLSGTPVEEVAHSAQRFLQGPQLLREEGHAPADGPAQAYHLRPAPV